MYEQWSYAEMALPRNGHSGLPGPILRSPSRGGGRARIPVHPYVLAEESNFENNVHNTVNSSTDSSQQHSAGTFGPADMAVDQAQILNAPEERNVSESAVVPWQAPDGSPSVDPGASASRST